MTFKGLVTVMVSIVVVGFDSSSILPLEDGRLKN